ncbi:hypothetical protein EPUL_003100 [Erysiphe pulchra]|uniref:Chalcone isomerase domain-containing protein n=1 Tax=Erysiphe pulchra TaxID=225359 RepID=A0A2S4PW95_9PEZI|nr:hypothetical protein EPUL_003100 [Erysiphe pulchra]
MVYSTIGVLCGMVGLYLTAIQVPLSPEIQAETTIPKPSTINRLDSRKRDEDQIMTLGREHRVITKEPGDESEERDNLVSTGNSVVPEFPRVLRLDQTSSLSSDQPEYQLLGLGIRTVSFLKIQVYVVGIYVAADDIVALQKKLIKRINPLATALVVGERDELKSMLNNPEKSEEIWDTILKDGACRMLIRIVPTRNTDFGHLRDAWVRTMTSRAQKVGWDDEKFGESVAQFKRIFARGSVPKGTELILSRGKKGNLEVWYHGNGRGQNENGIDKLDRQKDSDPNDDRIRNRERVILPKERFDPTLWTDLTKNFDLTPMETPFLPDLDKLIDEIIKAAYKRSDIAQHLIFALIDDQSHRWPKGIGRFLRTYMQDCEVRGAKIYFRGKLFLPNAG